MKKSLEEQNQELDESQSFDDFLKEAYHELHRIARRLFASERGDHTLQPTALVHEAYIKLSKRMARNYWDNAGQFYAFATGVMRQILVDYARGKNAEKRAGTQIQVPLEDRDGEHGLKDLEILDLEMALKELECRDARKVKLVELKFFGGLTNQEAANALGLSVKSIERDWRLARAFLHSRIRKND